MMAFWRMYRSPRVNGGKLTVRMWTDNDWPWFAALKVVANRAEAKIAFGEFVDTIKALDES